jgi:uncharacterized membrane-anchored protein YhcB (DUF1043 family)
MIWLTGIVCLVVGVVAGLLIAPRLSNNSPSKIEELETKIQELQRHHADYRDHVSDHFSATADLVHTMTESYRDVYQHLARGAQDLCNDDVAGKLLPPAEQSMFSGPDGDTMEPPKDYAPRREGNQSGALSEGFGLERQKSADDER